MRTYAIMNQKGGVGKTTTAAALAYNLAVVHGERALLIDCDSQGDLTSLLLPSDTMHADGEERPNLVDVMTERVWLYEVIYHTCYRRLDILPAMESLVDWELSCSLGDTQPNCLVLKEYLKELEADARYERVILDLPPNYSPTCIAALAAADEVIIPTGLDAFSAGGVDKLVTQIKRINRACPNVNVAGVLVTQDHRADVAADAVTTLRADSPVPVYKTTIRRSDKAIESTWASQPVGVWSPRSAPARDYRTWVEELLAKEDAEHERI